MREPRLLWMLPIGTLTSMIHGFSSTRVFTLRRRLHLLPLMLLDLLTQIVGLVVNVAGALRGYGVEALLAGQIISVLVFTAVSHNLPGVSHRDRLRMEPEARHQLMHFGRWIFFSSALSFGSSRADQIILARLLGAAPLGLYNIALNLGEMPGTLFLRLISGVAYPSLARVKNQRPGDFATEYYRLRLWLDVCFYTGAGVLVAISDILIRVLYDDRWQGAAMMLRIIIVRTALSAVGAVVEAGLMAHGKAEYAFRKNAVSTACLLVFMPIGSHFGGVQGVLWASVAATGASLCVLWPAALRLGFFRLHRELVLFVYLGIGYGVGLGVSGVLGSLLALLRVALRSWLHR